MVVEARYTPGPGVLIGAGAHWVVVTDPDDEDVLGEIWDVLTSPLPFGPPTLDQVLAVVESAFDGAPPALAMADLTAGSSITVSRGSGRVRLVGSARVLSLTDEHDPSATPARRLVRGMASASRVEVFPARASDEPPSPSG